MPVREDRPYAQFNFLVDLNGVPGMDANSYSGGFQEVSGIGMEVTVAEYRNGNDKDNGVRKVTMLNKSTDVTLKRGVIGSTSLYEWLNDIRNGNQKAFRDVTVTLMSENREAVLEFRLLRFTREQSGEVGTEMEPCLGAPQHKPTGEQDDDTPCKCGDACVHGCTGPKAACSAAVRAVICALKAW